MSADPVCVLDASAVIALLFGESGHERVAEALLAGGAVIGAANWAEIKQKTVQKGKDWSAAKGLLQAQTRLEPVTVVDAERAADLWEDYPAFSLGDRLCLALADRLAVQALTADAAWVNAGRALGGR